MSVERPENDQCKMAYSFNDAEFTFSDEERLVGNDLVEKVTEIKQFGSKDFEYHDFVVDQIFSLLDRLGEEGRNYKLFHGLSGSSLPEESWKEIPLDTEEGDYQKLIIDVLIPEMRKREAA